MKSMLRFLLLLTISASVVQSQTPPCVEYGIQTEEACATGCGDIRPTVFRKFEVINGTHLLKIRSCACNVDMYCLDHKVIAPMISPEGQQMAIDDHAITLSDCYRLGVTSDGMCSRLCDEVFPTNTGYVSHIHDNLVGCRCTLRWGDDPMTVCIDTPETFSSAYTTATTILTTSVVIATAAAAMLFAV